jgi:hypothetical protein
MDSTGCSIGNTAGTYFNYQIGARVNLKPIHFVLGCILILNSAALCAAQTAPEPENLDADNQSAQAPAPDSSQTPTQSPSPDKPSAGQPAQPVDQTQGQGQAKGSQSSKDGTAAGTSKDRLFFALPNFLTVENSGNVPPLTAGQKFKVVARGSFDPVQIVWYAALSGISQAENSEPGFGQGWAAYGKRYGAYAADGTIENFFVGAILPSVLHQDPRFFPKTGGSFTNRAGYAVSRIVVTRGDSGHHQFNFSEIFGSAIASAISTYSYHPHPGYHPETGVNVPYIASDRTLKNTASVWGSQVGYDTITLVIKEFWPDIRGKLKKQQH